MIFPRDQSSHWTHLLIVCPPLSHIRELRSTASPKWPPMVITACLLASLSGGICFIKHMR